ncbi:hypothetical protein ACRAWF_04875 [Streptomyces sp. L7]
MTRTSGVGVVGQAVAALLVGGDRGAEFRGRRGPAGTGCRVRRAARGPAASRISSGPSVSGKPWPRLIDPVFRARADILGEDRRPELGEPAVEEGVVRWRSCPSSCAQALDFLNSALAGETAGHPCFTHHTRRPRGPLRGIGRRVTPCSSSSSWQ